MNGYEGPAGVVLTPDEILITWKYLCLNPTAENASVRKKATDYLEKRGDIADGHCVSGSNSAG